MSRNGFSSRITGYESVSVKRILIENVRSLFAVHENLNASPPNEESIVCGSLNMYHHKMYCIS